MITPKNESTDKLRKELNATGLLTEQEVAAALGLSLATLRRWRMKSHGPAYLKLGSLVRYRPGEVRRWLDGTEVKTTGA